ncbi:hypothetical protein JCM17380_39030 [Desulfosporosinus burensis]
MNGGGSRASNMDARIGYLDRVTQQMQFQCKSGTVFDLHNQADTKLKNRPQLAKQLAWTSNKEEDINYGIRITRRRFFTS